MVTGSLAIDLDPAVFGNISAINVFSASGDQVGLASLQGRHADVQFTSDSGGVGRLPDFPVLQVTVPVLTSTNAGSAVHAQAKGPWRDLAGNTYAMSFQTSGITAGSGPSIQSIVPGGGSLPAGTQVQINGQGFSANTELRLDGVAWSGLQYISPQQLKFTLTGPADLTGKLVVARNPGGSQARYYSALTPTSTNSPGAQPIFPQSAVAVDIFRCGLYAFENPTAKAVGIVLTAMIFAIRPPPSKGIVVPPWGVYIDDSSSLSSYCNVQPIAALPIVRLEISPSGGYRAVGFRGSPSQPQYVWNWTPGDPPPAPMRVATLYQSQALTGTDDGNPWLSVSSSPGISTLYMLSADPSGLSLGSHDGVVSVTTPNTLSFPFGRGRVRFNVNSFPTIEFQTSGSAYVAPSNQFTTTLVVTSTSGAVPITVSSPDSWLSVTPQKATTPATLTVTALEPSALTGDRVGNVVVRGPGNSASYPVFLELQRPVYLYQADFAFSAEAGSTAAINQRVPVGSIYPFPFEVSTESGGTWLSARFVTTSTPNTDPSFIASADPSGLPTGQYHGRVAIHPLSSVGVTPLSVPVYITATLTVWARPTPQPAASPTSLHFTTPSGLGIHGQEVVVSTGSLPLPFSVKVQTDDGSNWLAGPVYPVNSVLYPFNANPVYTPATFPVGGDAASLAPGEYHGRVIVTSPPGSENTVVVPVTLTVTPALPPGARPLIASVVNAATLQPGPIAPGEIVSVFGMIAPDEPTGLTIGRDGKVTRSRYANRILFNGVPAPLTYVSATQVNAVVPYEIAGSSTATVEIDMGGVPSPAWTIPVASSSPGLFTQSGSGQGSAAILNEDNSLNTVSNPAPHGSIVQLFATGEGQTTPPGITGEVTQLDLKASLLPVKVEIGGLEANVVSATSAPKSVAGLFQINVRIPPAVQTGPAPIVVHIGSASSQSSATIWVR